MTDLPIAEMNDEALNAALNEFVLAATFWGLDKGLDRPSNLDNADERTRAFKKVKAAIQAYTAQRVNEALDRIEQSKPDYSEMDAYNRSFLKAMYTNTVDKAIQLERAQLSTIKSNVVEEQHEN